MIYTSEKGDLIDPFINPLTIFYLFSFKLICPVKILINSSVNFLFLIAILKYSSVEFICFSFKNFDKIFRSSPNSFFHLF